MVDSVADSTANSWVSNWLRKPTFRVALGYALAIVSVSAAFAAAQAFLYLHLPLAIMSFSFCAIAITFWYGGVIAGDSRSCVGRAHPHVRLLDWDRSDLAHQL